MLKRIIVTALLGGALLFTTPATAHADKRGNDDRQAASHSDRDSRQDNHGGRDAHEARDARLPLR